MKEEMEPSQAFWFYFVDQEIPEELLSPRSKLLGKISGLVRGRKVELSARNDCSSRNDVCLTIPARFADHLGISPGDCVTIALDRNRLIVEKRT